MKNIDTQTLAIRLGISHRTLENWRSRGEGPPFHKLGGRVIYDSEDVDEWLSRCQVEEKESTESRQDIINNPPHYTEGREIEPISVIEDWQLEYHLGQALKYISRAGRKKGNNSLSQDLNKAIWYLERRIWIEEIEDARR
jgi:predicted DNA-binding transcriptional regulator AlpA